MHRANRHQGFSIEVQPWRSIAEATSMSFNRTTGEFLLEAIKAQRELHAQVTHRHRNRISAFDLLPQLQIQPLAACRWS